MSIALITIVGRTLLAALFILAGIAKIIGPKPFREHMVAYHVPPIVLPLVVMLELGAGIALLLGWQLLFAAGGLALFCATTAVVFHRDLADRAERTLFFKDLALAGALLVMTSSAWPMAAVASIG